MQKIVFIFQRFIRLVMLIVAVVMLGFSATFVGIHMANRNLAKTEITATVVKTDTYKRVKFDWKGQAEKRRPLDSIFKDLGPVNSKIQVFVTNKYPDRVFISEDASAMLYMAGFMAGWSLLLFIILIGEYQLMSRIKKLEETAS